MPSVSRASTSAQPSSSSCSLRFETTAALRAGSDADSLPLIRVGRAADVVPPHAVAPRLVELVDPRLALRAMAHGRWVGSVLRAAEGVWARRIGEARAGELARIAEIEGGRITLGAAALISVVRRWRPGLMAAFDEVGTWARLMPAVA